MNFIGQLLYPFNVGVEIMIKDLNELYFFLILRYNRFLLLLRFWRIVDVVVVSLINGSHYSSSSLMSSRHNVILLLFFKHILYNFLFIFIVLVLEHVWINFLHIEVKRVTALLFEFICIIFGNLIYLFVMVDTFLDNLINVDWISIKDDFVIFHLHYFCRTMEEDFLIIFLTQICVCSLVPLLNNNLIQLELNSLPFNYLLFYSVLSHKPVDVYFFLLADTMTTIHCLKIDLWVPIWIKEDNVISCV